MWFPLEVQVFKLVHSLFSVYILRQLQVNMRVFEDPYRGVVRGRFVAECDFEFHPEHLPVCIPC
jgi:hypothetical protein